MKLQVKILESRYEKVKKENAILIKENLKLNKQIKELKKENQELLYLLNVKLGGK